MHNVLCAYLCRAYFCNNYFSSFSFLTTSNLYAYIIPINGSLHIIDRTIVSSVIQQANNIKITMPNLISSIDA